MWYITNPFRQHRENIEGSGNTEGSDLDPANAQVLCRKYFQRHSQEVKSLEQKRDELERSLLTATRRGNHEKSQFFLVECREINGRLDELNKLGVPKNADDSIYVFSSWTLYQSYLYCTRDNSEGMHFVVGIEHDGARIGMRCIGFPYQYRSIAGASGDHLSTHKIGIQMHEWKHVHVALIHSHPHGCMNQPSATDWRTQELWEKTTKIIGGIWNRSSEIRFYGMKPSFKIAIIGNYVEKLDENLYRLKLDELDELSTLGNQEIQM